MGVASFVPEVWSPVILASLKRAEVYANLVNRDYEGDIAQRGDTVHINSVSRPTINAYSTYQTLTVEQLTTADRTLVINKADYFAFSLDDIDKRQQAGNTLEMAMVEAAYALVDKVDQLIAGLYTDVQTANRVNAGAPVSVLTGAIAGTQLIKLRQKLDEANVPIDGRYVVVPPWYYALLLDNVNFIANPAPNTASALLTGMLGGIPPTGMIGTAQNVPGGGTFGLLPGYVGKAYGMDVFLSNNVQIITTNQYAVLAGIKAAISFAEQVNEL